MGRLREVSTKRVLLGLVGVAGMAAMSVATALPAAAQTGAPIGGCPTAGGWQLDDYASDNQSAILVDQVYGNNDGYLCVKLPSDHAPYPMLIDDVASLAAGR